MDIDARIPYYAPAVPAGPDERPEFTSLPLRAASVRVTDMRGRTGTRLDREGFTLLRMPSAVRDFRDRDEVLRVYVPEAGALLRDLTGCTRTALLNFPVIRASAASGADRPPGTAPTGDIAHADFAPWAAARLLHRAHPPFPPARGPAPARLALFNIWRPLTPPPQDRPLALCDARSVAPADRQVCSITLDTSRGDVQTWENYAYRHSPAHRWHYCSDMARDEVLVFRSYDCAPAGSEPVPHSAFANPAAPAGSVPPRASVEIRMFAFWD